MSRRVQEQQQQHALVYASVLLLNNSNYQVKLTSKSSFYDIFEAVCYHLCLEDTGLFGLAIQNDEGEYQYLDLDLKVHKYVQKHPKLFPQKTPGVANLFFRVQYYVDALTHVSSAATLKQYYLQLKQNFIHYPFHYPEEKCFLLAAYALQMEAPPSSDDLLPSSFDPRKYFPAWVVDERGPEFIRASLPSLFKDVRDLTSVEAAKLFVIEVSCRAPFAFNLHLYKMRRKKDAGTPPIFLGICPAGLEIYEKLAYGSLGFVSIYKWATIDKVNMEKKKFELKAHRLSGGRKLKFYTPSVEWCRYLFGLVKHTHRVTMGHQRRAAEHGETDELERQKRRYRESYIYSSDRDQEWEKEQSTIGSVLSLHHAAAACPSGIPNKRISIISNSSSNTTSGIVSDRLRVSFDESEDDGYADSESPCSPSSSLPTNRSTTSAAPTHEPLYLLPAGDFEAVEGPPPEFKDPKGVSPDNFIQTEETQKDGAVHEESLSAAAGPVSGQVDALFPVTVTAATVAEGNNSILSSASAGDSLLDLHSPAGMSEISEQQSVSTDGTRSVQGGSLGKPVQRATSDPMKKPEGVSDGGGTGRGKWRTGASGVSRNKPRRALSDRAPRYYPRLMELGRGRSQYTAGGRVASKTSSGHVSPTESLSPLYSPPVGSPNLFTPSPLLSSGESILSLSSSAYPTLVNLAAAGRSASPTLFTPVSSALVPGGLPASNNNEPPPPSYEDHQRQKLLKLGLAPESASAAAASSMSASGPFLSPHPMAVLRSSPIPPVILGPRIVPRRRGRSSPSPLPVIMASSASPPPFPPHKPPFGNVSSPETISQTVLNDARSPAVSPQPLFGSGALTSAQAPSFPQLIGQQHQVTRSGVVPSSAGLKLPSTELSTAEGSSSKMLSPLRSSQELNHHQPSQQQVRTGHMYNRTAGGGGVGHHRLFLKNRAASAEILSPTMEEALESSSSPCPVHNKSHPEIDKLRDLSTLSSSFPLITALCHDSDLNSSRNITACTCSRSASAASRSTHTRLLSSSQSSIPSAVHGASRKIRQADGGTSQQRFPSFSTDGRPISWHSESLDLEAISGYLNGTVTAGSPTPSSPLAMSQQMTPVPSPSTIGELLLSPAQRGMRVPSQTSRPSRVMSPHRNVMLQPQHHHHSSSPSPPVNIQRHNLQGWPLHIVSGGRVMDTSSDRLMVNPSMVGSAAPAGFSHA